MNEWIFFLAWNTISSGIDYLYNSAGGLAFFRAFHLGIPWEHICFSHEARYLPIHLHGSRAGPGISKVPSLGPWAPE